jgi:hypothetical protein
MVDLFPMQSITLIGIPHDAIIHGGCDRSVVVPQRIQKSGKIDDANAEAEGQETSTGGKKQPVLWPSI